MQAIVFYKSQLASHILTFAVCHISNKALEPVGVNFEIPAGQQQNSADGEAASPAIFREQADPELMREMGFDAAWKSGFPGADAALRHNGSPRSAS